MDTFIFLFFSYKDCRVRPRLVKAIPTVLKKVCAHYELTCFKGVRIFVGKCIAE